MSDDRAVVVLQVVKSTGVLSKAVAVLIRFGLHYESHRFAELRASGAQLAILNARGVIGDVESLKQKLGAIPGVLKVAEIRAPARIEQSSSDTDAVPSTG